jgi:hypothetical protein
VVTCSHECINRGEKNRVSLARVPHRRSSNRWNLPARFTANYLAFIAKLQVPVRREIGNLVPCI